MKIDAEKLEKIIRQFIADTAKRDGSNRAVAIGNVGGKEIVLEVRSTHDKRFVGGGRIFKQWECITGD